MPPFVFREVSDCYIGGSGKDIHLDFNCWMMKLSMMKEVHILRMREGAVTSNRGSENVVYLQQLLLTNGAALVTNHLEKFATELRYLHEDVN